MKEGSFPVTCCACRRHPRNLTRRVAMAPPSRLRPRPQSWRVGTARILLSVAAVVRSGLHNTNAYTPTSTGQPRSGALDSPAAMEAFARTCQSRHHLPSPALLDGVLCAGWVEGSGHERPGGGSLIGGSGRRGSGSSRAGALAAVASAVDVDVSAGGSGPALVEEKASGGKAKPQMRAMTRGLNSITAYTAYGAREKTGRKNSSLTMADEIVLVEHIKILSRYLKAREQLEADLGGREPTREEWASSLNISPDELALQMMASARAQERIVEANVGLIKTMARRHHPATMAKGSITSDVIQEGSLALLRAAETYNPQLGYRFSTYAGWWVRDRVTRCVTQQARIIRLPQYVHNFRRTASIAEAALLKELGRRPTHQEIAEQMGVDVERVTRLLNCPDASSLDVAPPPSSPMGGSGSGGGGGGRGAGAKGPAKAAVGAGYRHEKVACSMVNPEQQAEADLFESKLDKLMSVLSEDERLVVKLRYGLGGSSPTTLNEVAQRAGSTTHRVRMVETRALNKLRRRPGRHRHIVARGRGRAVGSDSGGTRASGARRAGTGGRVGGVLAREFG